ncbi:MAG: hypothetical protein ACO3N9_05260 [Alphaproteobacteria bacterium]
MTESNVVNINGVHYNENDLEINQQYLVMQIQDLQNQHSTLQFKMDQTQKALQAMTNDLIASLAEKKKQPKLL